MKTKLTMAAVLTCLGGGLINLAAQDRDLSLNDGPVYTAASVASEFGEGWAKKAQGSVLSQPSKGKPASLTADQRAGTGTQAKSNTPTPQPNQDQKRVAIGNKVIKGAAGFSLGSLLLAGAGTVTNNVSLVALGLYLYAAGMLVMGTGYLIKNRKSVGGKGLLALGVGTALLVSPFLGAPAFLGYVGLGIALIGAPLSLFP